MKNSFSESDYVLNFQNIQKSCTTGFYTCDKYANIIFLWISGCTNFILIKEDGVYLSSSDWTREKFKPFNGEIKLCV